MKRNGPDISHMRLALALARKGGSRVYPNPKVGCVVVKDGRIVGRGYHGYFGGPHAEINAIAAAGENARGAALYVTLEPCNHWGKTPPCCDAVLKAGIRKVVVSMPDPNPRTAGKGIAKLRKNGVTVIQGVLRREAERLNREYIRSFGNPRPYVLIKAAMSMDGKIATRTGDSKWITGEQARERVHRMRSRFDGILVGIRTVLNDDPSLTSHGQGRNPVRIVIDPGLKIPLSSRVLDREAPTVIIHASKNAKVKLERLRKMRAIPVYIEKRNGIIDFKYIFNKLNNMSIYRVLIEGGGTTIEHALSSGCVDEAIFFIAPKIIGGKNAPSPVEGPGIARMAQAVTLGGLKIGKIGKDIVISSKVIKK